MSQKESGWKEKIRQDYKGILHEEQILETIAYWEDIISEAIKIAVSQREKEIAEEVEKLIKIENENDDAFDYISVGKTAAYNKVLKILKH